MEQNDELENVQKKCEIVRFFAINENNKMEVKEEIKRHAMPNTNKNDVNIVNNYVRSKSTRTKGNLEELLGISDEEGDKESMIDLEEQSDETGNEREGNNKDTGTLGVN